MQFQITSYLFSCCRNCSVANSHLLRCYDKSDKTSHSDQSRFSAGKIVVAGCGVFVEGAPIVVTAVTARAIFAKLMVGSPPRSILLGLASPLILYGTCRVCSWLSAKISTYIFEGLKLNANPLLVIGSYDNEKLLTLVKQPASPDGSADSRYAHKLSREAALIELVKETKKEGAFREMLYWK